MRTTGWISAVLAVLGVVALVTYGAGAKETDPRAGEVLWSADMEGSGLARWSAGDGGGEFDTGGARVSRTPARRHGGRASARLVLPRGSGGARLFRWGESRRHRELVYSAWYLVPKRYRATRPRSSRYWIVFQFKSTSEDRRRNDPFWYVTLGRAPRRGLAARLAWGYQSGLEGPHRGERGWRTYGRRPVPVGRWFRIVARLRQSNDFDGAIEVSVDGRRLATLEGVRTGWPNCTYAAWCVDQAWAVTHYSDGLAPAPAELYVDDASIAWPAAMELGGLEPPTSWVRSRRSPN